MWLLIAAAFTGATSIHYQTPMLGPMAREFGGFVANYLDWRWPYALAALMFAALSPALVARLPRTKPHTSLPYPHLLASIVALIGRHAEMRRVVGIQFLLGICYGGFWATIATMLLRVHGLGPT